MYLSVLIPVYNEVDNVRPLCESILQSLEDIGRECEVIFVDDCSEDGTLAVLEGLVDADPRVRTIKLRKNFGQTIAMRVGFEHARGDIIVTMDGDQQNDPRDIPMLVQKLAEGYDVVAGWRRNRNDPFLSRKLPSKLANWIIR